MAVKLAETLVLVVGILSMFDIAIGNKNWSTAAGNWNHSTADNNFWGFWHKNATKAGPNKFVVGGSENWHFGFNYTDWSIKSGPFYLNDALVFKYDPPNDTTHPHSVYLLPNFWSLENCDFRYARKVGEVNAGAGQGFEFVLKRWQPYFFACGERNGTHCKDGLMKFAVWPKIRWYN